MKSLLFMVIAGCFLLGGRGLPGHAESLADDEILGMLREVVDPEGRANLRSGPSLQSKVVGQVTSGGVVAIVPGQKGDWVKLLERDVTGPPRFIHGSRLQPVARWKQTAVTEGIAGETGILKLADFHVEVKAGPFVIADHRITRDPDGMPLVDGKRPWGQDGGLPGRSLAISVKQHGKAIVMPSSAFQDLYEPALESLLLLTPPQSTDQAWVMMTNSDGAGAYCVVWAFKKGRYCGRVVFSP